MRRLYQSPLAHDPPAMPLSRSPSSKSLRSLAVLAGFLYGLLASTLAHAQDLTGAEGALGTLDDFKPPTLVFESPPELRGQVEILERYDPNDYVPIMDLLGLDDPGPPIRVHVVPEGSDMARVMPSWGVAYAVGGAGTIVLVPSRIPTYPNDDMPSVLRHEVAHVLVARAAGYRPVPRWFNEGVATVAGRRWKLRDRGELMLAAIPRDGLTMAEIDDGFHGGGVQARRAYALSTAYVRWLLEEEGDTVVARILRRIAEGQSFEIAFRNSTGHSLGESERMYWDQLNFWNRWVPFLTSSSFAWLLITLLFLYAYRRRKARDQARMQQWEEEELLQDELRDLIRRDPEALQRSLDGRSSHEKSGTEWVN